MVQILCLGKQLGKFPMGSGPRRLLCDKAGEG